jgi:hypothetical protein
MQHGVFLQCTLMCDYVLAPSGPSTPFFTFMAVWHAGVLDVTRVCVCVCVCVCVLRVSCACPARVLRVSCACPARVLRVSCVCGSPSIPPKVWNSDYVPKNGEHFSRTWAHQFAQMLVFSLGNACFYAVYTLIVYYWSSVRVAQHRACARVGVVPWAMAWEQRLGHHHALCLLC